MVPIAAPSHIRPFGSGSSSAISQPTAAMMPAAAPHNTVAESIAIRKAVPPHATWAAATPNAEPTAASASHVHTPRRQNAARCSRRIAVSV